MVTRSITRRTGRTLCARLAAALSAMLLLAGGGWTQAPESEPEAERRVKYSLTARIDLEANALWGAAGIGQPPTAADLTLAEIRFRADRARWDIAASGSLADGGEWRDLFVRWSHRGFAARYGQFKEPASLDRQGAGLETSFVDTPRFTRTFGMRRRPAIAGSWSSDRASITLAALYGSLDGVNFDEEGAGAEALGARLTRALTFGADFETHIGVYARSLAYNDGGVRLRARPTRTAPDTLIVDFDGADGGPTADRSILVGAEFAQSRGALHWALEAAQFEMQTRSGAGEGAGYGGSLQISWSPTGEQRRYHAPEGRFRRDAPVTPFRLDSGGGGWELAARIDYLDLTAFDAGRSAHLTLGVNWYASRDWRVLANLISEQGWDGAPDGGAAVLKLQTVF